MTRAERYRGRAAFIDALARQQSDPGLRAEIFRIAMTYRHIAELADKIAAFDIDGNRCVNSISDIAAQTAYSREMALNDPFVCTRCGDRANYHGRVSAPPSMIYKCAKCGHETWIPSRHAPVQQQQQQQQQQQPKLEDKD